jgi:copper chaperone CopZ
METNVRIGKIHSIACVNRIESKLKTMGINIFHMDYQTNIANILYDEYKIQPNEIVIVIKNLGYDASIKT